MSATRDYRNVVIEMLADENVVLREQVGACHEQIEDLAERAVNAEVDRDAYRAVAVAGIHYAHELDEKLTEVRARLLHALNDARDLRVALLRQEDRRVA